MVDIPTLGSILLLVMLALEALVYYRLVGRRQPFNVGRTSLQFSTLLFFQFLGVGGYMQSRVRMGPVGVGILLVFLLVFSWPFMSLIFYVYFVALNQAFEKARDSGEG